MDILMVALNIAWTIGVFAMLLTFVMLVICLLWTLFMVLVNN